MREGNRNAAKTAEDKTRGPWTRWRGSRVGRFIRFAETYLRPPRGASQGQLMHLLTWEKDFVEEFYADLISAAVLVMARGGGKSTLMAALATFDVFEDSDQGAPVIPIVAASLAQAKSSVFSQAVAMIQAEDALAQRSIYFAGIGMERILVPRSGGEMMPKAAEPDTLQGLDIYPTGYVDEIGHIEIETWNAVLMGRKRKGARVLGAGTPGPNRDTPIYLIRNLVKDGNAPPSLLWKAFTSTPGISVNDEANWKLSNPSLDAGFPDIAFLRNAAVMTPEPLFRTYHLAEWDVVGHDSWLGPDALTIWDGLEDTYELDPDEPTYIGIDVGLVRDSTAVVVVQERPDKRLHAVAKIWMPAAGQTVDISDVIAYLRGLAKTYINIKAVSFDRRLFELPSIMLLEDGLPMVEVSQSVEQMTPIIGALYERIRAGGLSHEKDISFGQQVINAVPRLNERGYTLSKSKSAPRGHIDACVALALAVDRFSHKPKKSPRAIVL